MTASTSVAPLVRHHVAGGQEHGGGIGRLVGYVLDSRAATLSHDVVDTRGSSWRPAPSLVRLLRSMGIIAADSLRATPALQHFHVAGRGSTARKTILGLWARGLGLPYVAHLHDYDYAADLARRPRWQIAAIRAFFGGAAQIIVLGRRDGETVARDLGAAPDRVCVLRNCVPDPEPARQNRNGPVRILFLGRLGPRKGVPELLTALADPAMPASGWSAVLAGDGEVDAYRADVDRLGLADRVTLPGWVGAAEAARLRADADILVLPSHAEGFAMAVLEGLAQGLAVVTTRVGAHDEVLEDGRTCLFVEPGNAGDLADALSRLLSDAPLRKRLGEAGRELFLSQFGIEGYVRSLERLQMRAIEPGATVPSAT